MTKGELQLTLYEFSVLVNIPPDCHQGVKTLRRYITPSAIWTVCSKWSMGARFQIDSPQELDTAARRQARLFLPSFDMK